MVIVDPSGADMEGVLSPQEASAKRAIENVFRIKAPFRRGTASPASER
jgi:hypothetical protein